MEIKMNQNQEGISFEDMAKEMGISVEGLINFAIKEGLMDEKGMPTEKALKEGLLTVEKISKEPKNKLVFQLMDDTDISEREKECSACIIKNVLDLPLFEFGFYHNNNGLISVGIHDGGDTLYHISLFAAKKLQEYLLSNLNTYAVDSSEDDTKLECIVTLDMDPKERHQWEAENCACVIESDNGGILEFQKSHYYSTDENGNKVPGSETPTLAIAVCDDMGEDEVYITVSSKDEVRKLRDYLNNYLEDNI